MATLRNLLNSILFALLIGCAPDRLPPVSEAPPRSIGPELTVFPASVVLPFDSAQGDTTVRLSEVEVSTPIQEPPPLTTRERLTLIYQGEVGTREVGKNNHGPGPKKYLAVCGLSEGYAYCACFVKWGLLKVGIPTRGTAWSPSWSTGKEIYWKQGKFLKSVDVQPGDVFTLYYQHLKRVGHVGFVDIWDDPRADDWVFTVEGNTNGEGSREGDGVHNRRRLKRSIYTIGNYIDTSIQSLPLP